MESPLKSAFLLQDKSLELVDLVQKSFTHTQLAYLSACRTAASNETLPEEAVHLAAGMLMAGFQDVVATLWAIGDDDATFVAEHFYRYMKEEGGWDSTNSAYGLHYAVGKLRDSIGVKYFLRWIPFIHLGL
jgi:CHAT domain-containing protein